MKKLAILLVSMFFILLSSSCIDKVQSENKIQGYCNYPINDSLKTETRRAYKIQEQLLKIYSKINSTTVRINGVGGSPATGVLVSEDGYILTAGHLIKSLKGQDTKVRLSDGSIYTVSCLGRDVNSDYGLMKIKEKGTFPYAELGNSSSLGKDEACIMMGHAASFNKERLAVPRIGFYEGITSFHFLRTTCIMMPGDSGGPLFDLEGKVIGVCSYINKGIDFNFYSAIDNIKKNWDKLLKGEVFNNERSTGGFSKRDEIVEAPIKNNPYVLKGGKQTLSKVFPQQINDIKISVVSIESSIDKETIHTKGTVIARGGYIISKSSMVGNNVNCITYKNEKLSAQVIRRNTDNDLVILKVDKLLKPIKINKTNIKIGTLLGTVTDENAVKYAGVLGLETQKMEAKSKGYLGVIFSEKDSLETIQFLAPNQAAEKAGLQIGDQVLKINAQLITKNNTAFNFLNKTKPGETINITILRENKEKEIKVILGKLILEKPTGNHVAFAIKVNKRNNGFKNVFTHDMPIKFNECGTPIINLEGNVVGINIARKNRTATLAIPINIVQNITNYLISGN